MPMMKNKTRILSFTFAVLFVISAVSPYALLYGEKSIKVNDSTEIGIDALFRAYMLNDQRLQWSGLETTFGVESVLTATIRKKLSWGALEVKSQFFLNQEFDKNRLTDETREKYLQNYEINPFEIKQLFIQLTRGSLTIGLGKHPTIFGRNYNVGFSNAYFDEPFIRNEAILHYETGVFLRYNPGIFIIDLAVVNGSEGMDTNSSKGGMARIGLQGKSWAFGVSAKMQDGIGSEWQKRYNNHAGVDLMFKAGPFRFSSEFIYDEYGFHREYSIDDVFWGRSYYYRDIFYKHKTPIKGYGGYADLQYETKGFLLDLNYGEYHPEEIGHIYHDDPIKRAIVKIRIRLADGLHAFGVGLFENKREKEPLFDGASDYGFLLGCQYRL